MKTWILENLNELMPNAAGAANEIDSLDLRLRNLRSHSLKMVTFLARFNRHFGKGPKIMDFINEPTVATLEASLAQKEIASHED